MHAIIGLCYLLFGAVFIWLGAFMLITSMVPREVGIAFAEKHGAWMREHLFNLPPAKNTDSQPLRRDAVTKQEGE